MSRPLLKTEQRLALIRSGPQRSRHPVAGDARSDSRGSRRGWVGCAGLARVPRDVRVGPRAGRRSDVERDRRRKRRGARAHPAAAGDRITVRAGAAIAERRSVGMHGSHAHRRRGGLSPLDDGAEGSQRDDERDQRSTEHGLRRDITSEAARAPQFPPVGSEFLRVVRGPDQPQRAVSRQTYQRSKAPCGGAEHVQNRARCAPRSLRSARNCAA